MRTQVVFNPDRDVDYNATYEKALGHSKVRSIDKTEKGLIWIKLAYKDIKVLVSPYGKIEFAYNTEEELKETLKILEDVLVPVQGENLTIKLTYKLEPHRYVGCTPDEEVLALWEEFASRSAARPFLRRKRIGAIIAPLKGRPLLKVREGRPILSIILKQANTFLERLEQKDKVRVG